MNNYAYKPGDKVIANHGKGFFRSPAVIGTVVAVNHAGNVAIELSASKAVVEVAPNFLTLAKSTRPKVSIVGKTFKRNSLPSPTMNHIFGIPDDFILTVTGRKKVIKFARPKYFYKVVDKNGSFVNELLMPYYHLRKYYVEV